MTLSFYIADDYQVVDAYSTGTFFRRQTETTFDNGTAVTSVLRQDITKEEMQSRGLLAKAGVVWHLWANVLTGAVPKVGDVFRDSSSVRWTVQQVGIMSLGTRYELVTIRER